MAGWEPRRRFRSSKVTRASPRESRHVVITILRVLLKRAIERDKHDDSVERKLVQIL